MINWIKCLFGFHQYSEWKEEEVTAGLGSHKYHSRICMRPRCMHVHYNGLE